MSQRLYQRLDPKPEVRPTTEKIKGPNHSPIWEWSIKVKIPELSVVIDYDFIVDDIKVDLLTDASMLHFAQIQLRYDTQELSRKWKVIKCVASIRSKNTEPEGSLSIQTGSYSLGQDFYFQDEPKG